MDDDILLVAVLALALLALGGLVSIGLLPSWFAIHGNWNAFNFWFGIAISISRIIYALCIPLYLLLSLAKGSLSYFTGAIEATILAIWGTPVYKKAVLQMVFTQLSGIEFQRTILTIIFIYGLTVSLALTSKSGRSEEDS